MNRRGQLYILTAVLLLSLTVLYFSSSLVSRTSSTLVADSHESLMVELRYLIDASLYEDQLIDARIESYMAAYEQFMRGYDVRMQYVLVVYDSDVMHVLNAMTKTIEVGSVSIPDAALESLPIQSFNVTYQNQQYAIMPVVRDYYQLTGIFIYDHGDDRSVYAVT